MIRGTNNERARKKKLPEKWCAAEILWTAEPCSNGWSLNFSPIKDTLQTLENYWRTAFSSQGSWRSTDLPRNGDQLPRPIIVKKPQFLAKRYSCLVKYAHTKTVHQEVSYTMVLRQFVARGGKPTKLNWDSRSNSVGARRYTWRW